MAQQLLLGLNGSNPDPNQPQTEKPKHSSRSIGMSLMFLLILVMFTQWRSSQDDASFWLYLFYHLTFIALCMVGLWTCAKRNLFFTLLSPNQIAIIESGKVPTKLVGIPFGGRIMGFEIVYDNEPQKYYSPLEYFGMFYIGLPWNTVKLFTIDHIRLKQNISEEKLPERWIERDSEERHAPESFLLVNPLRPHVEKGIELAKGYLVDMALQAELRLRKPIIALYKRSSSQPNKNGIYKANFYVPITEMLSTAIDNVCKGMGYDPDMDEDGNIIPDGKIGFLAEDKNATGRICLTICRELNKEDALVEMSGYEVVRVFIPRWNLSSDEQRELVKQREIATIARDVANLKAESDNAEFRAALETATKAFDGKEVDYTELMRMVKGILETKNISKLGNLSVYAAGGSNMAISTPPPAGKKNKGGK